MTYEDIQEVIPSISVACLYHAYGKLDRLFKLGMEEATDDFYMMYYELLDISADFVSADYNEYYNTSKWYFSFTSMMEYYCHIQRLNFQLQSDAILPKQSSLI